MRTRLVLAVGLVLLGSAANVYSQVTLGRPTPLPAGPSFEPIRTVNDETPRVVRGQAPPAPPPFGGTPAPAVFPTPTGPGGADMYNKGVVTSDADLGGFWVRAGDKAKRCWDDLAGGASGAFQGENRFKCDQRFQNFASPVTNPYFFEDPRALTEIRPVFMWQRTPSDNPVWAGGNNFEFALRGSVAITPNISLVISRLGFSNINPQGGDPNFTSGTGFSEVALGPKFTFGNEASNSVFALGLTFLIPAGSGSVQANTGHTMLVPYFSYAQNFGRLYDGSFNFMNTTGYTFRTDNTRVEAFYSSFHLDYDWQGLHRFYPLVELNWRYYSRNGGVSAVNFERSDLANLGAMNVSGGNELTLAIGTRVRLNQNIWFGIAGEFNILSNSDGRHLDKFRLTTDLIFRY